MTKYLDSKGLSYLWQRIKAELATKEGVHEHPYVKDDTVIKIGTDDTVCVSLVKATVEGQKDSWTIPFAATGTTGVVKGYETATDVSGDTWHQAPIIDGYVWYKDTLADPNTVTSENGGNLTLNKVVLGAGDKKVKVSTFEIGAETYATPATFGGTSLLATEAAVKEYVDGVAGGVTSGLQLSYTDGTSTLEGKKVIKLTDTNNSVLSFELDATPFIKDGMLKSVQILKYASLTEEDATAQWVTLSGEEVTNAIKDAPASAPVGSIWLYFEWNTDASDTATVAWLPATDLIKDCSADTDRGIDSDTNEDGGHKFYVKTTGIEEGKPANVSTGFDKDGKVVGYVDLSAYQKSADLVAFTQADLDAIFDSADALYAAETNGDEAKTKNTPAFPEVDPLAE